MPSFRAIFLGVVGLANLAVSQFIDPNTVNLTTRLNWCVNQRASCPLLCLQTPGASGEPIQNSCESGSLAYVCVCSNGISPNASEFSQTIPYFECTEFNNQCVKNCAANDATCQTACRTTHSCGAQSPKRVNLSTVTTSSTQAPATDSATATSGGSGGSQYTGFGGAATTSSASSGGSGSSAASTMAIGLGQTYGLGLVSVGFFAGFAFLL